jgi:hypothetical protein
MLQIFDISSLESAAQLPHPTTSLLRESGPTPLKNSLPKVSFGFISCIDN